MAAEQIRVEDDTQHVANLALVGNAVFPGRHALPDQLPFRRQVRIRVIVNTVIEIIVDKHAAEFNNDVFLGERLISQVTDYIVTVGNAVGAGAERQGGRQRELIVTAGVRRTEPGRDRLAREDRL